MAALRHRPGGRPIDAASSSGASPRSPSRSASAMARALPCRQSGSRNATSSVSRCTGRVSGICWWRSSGAGLANVRIFNEDAVEVLERRIPPASLDVVQVFFPDPWHKKRHHKRRLVQTGLRAAGRLAAASGGGTASGDGLGRLCGTCRRSCGRRPTCSCPMGRNRSRNARRTDLRPDSSAAVNTWGTGSAISSRRRTVRGNVSMRPPGCGKAVFRRTGLGLHRGLDHQHGAGGLADHPLGDAAHQQAAQPGAPVAADDDHVRVLAFRGLDDDFVGRRPSSSRASISICSSVAAFLTRSTRLRLGLRLRRCRAPPR
jgi:hypothetical protein